MAQTEAQVQAEISARVAILQETSKYGGINSSGTLKNFLTRETEAYVASDPPGDYSQSSNAAIKAYRAQVAALVGGSAARSLLDPLWFNYADAVGGNTPKNTVAETLSYLYKRFVDNTLRVKSRNITYGTPTAAGGNVGTGNLYRLTVDAYGFAIEATTPDAKRLDCISDSAKETPIHEEIFQFRGGTPRTDPIVITGSGVGGTVRAFSSRLSLLSGPSFDTLDGSSITALTSIPGWTVGAETIANYNLSTDYYRTALGVPTPRSVKYLNNGKLTQAFTVAPLKAGFLPMLLRIAYKPTCTGTLTITMGSATKSVTLTNTGAWAVLVLDRDTNLWPKNFASVSGGDVSTTVTIELSSYGGSGSVLVDDACMVQMVPFDGLWYAPIGGVTPWVGAPLGSKDYFTITDALAGSDSILQQWFWRAYGFYFPHATGTPVTWAEPSV